MDIVNLELAREHLYPSKKGPCGLIDGNDVVEEFRRRHCRIG